MPNRFNPDAAKGMSSVIQFDLTGDDAGEYHIVINDGKCEVKEGKHDSLQVTSAAA